MAFVSGPIGRGANTPVRIPVGAPDQTNLFRRSCQAVPRREHEKIADRGDSKQPISSERLLILLDSLYFAPIFNDRHTRKFAIRDHQEPRRAAAVAVADETDSRSELDQQRRSGELRCDPVE